MLILPFPPPPIERTGTPELFLSAMPRPLTMDRYRVISAADFRVMSLTRIRPYGDTLHFGLSKSGQWKEEARSLNQWNQTDLLWPCTLLFLFILLIVRDIPTRQSYLRVN